MVQGHLRVGRVQGPDVHVVEAALSAQEHLVQRPARPDLRLFITGLGHHAASGLLARAAALAAYAEAASRTQAPSSWAAVRRAMR